MFLCSQRRLRLPGSNYLATNRSFNPCFYANGSKGCFLDVLTLKKGTVPRVCSLVKKTLGPI